MMPASKSHIVLGVLAALAAAVLFITYGTVLPAAPFVPVQLNGPTAVDSDGEFTGIVDTESHRALILNAEGDLTGVGGPGGKHRIDGRVAPQPDCRKEQRERPQRPA